MIKLGDLEMNYLFICKGKEYLGLLHLLKKEEIALGL